VNNKQSQIPKSENSYAIVIRRSGFFDWRIIPHTTVSKHTQT